MAILPPHCNIEVDGPAKTIPADLTATQIIKKHIEVTGGEAAWAKVKDMKSVYEMEMQGMKININTTNKAPNKFVLDINMAGNSFQKIVFDGTKGYMTAQGQRKEFDEKEIKKYAEEGDINKDASYLLPGYQSILAGIEKVDGKDAYQVDITKPSGAKVSEFYDVSTGFKIKSLETGDEGYTQCQPHLAIN